MGGSAIRTDSNAEWRFSVPTDVALDRINARFTADEVMSWRQSVRSRLRQQAPLGDLAREIGVTDVAPGSGGAFHAWLDEDWSDSAARRLQALLWHVVWSPSSVSFDWEACEDWSQFDLQVRRDPGTGHRDVLVRTPHP